MALPSNVRVVSELPADHSGYSVVNEQALRSLSSAEDRHFWHLSRNRLIASRLKSLGVSPPARLLELGCGGGCVAAFLSSQGYGVTGVEGHLSRVLEAAVRAPAAKFVVHDLAEGTEALCGGEYDAACLFDVIEHLDRPAVALEQALATVRRGGLLVGTVPALMALWSDVDKHAGHRRRYEREELESLLASLPGTSVVEIAPFNRQLVPLMWLQRRLVVKEDVGATAEANFKVPPALVNQSFLVASRIEQSLAGWLDRTPLPGASLWFALRRLG